MSHWLLIVIAAGSNIILNLSLMKGGKNLDLSNPLSLLLSILMSGWMWLSVLSALCLLAAFISAVRMYSLSLTYTAVTALAMVALTAIGILFQHENVSAGRGAGLCLIVVGLILSAVAGKTA